jgi:mRNA interferase HigB
MIVFTYGALRAFGDKHADAMDALDEWHEKTSDADWNGLEDIRQTFGAADYVGNDRYVFNIKGNRYRLVAMIHFAVRSLYVRGIFTHADYDRIKDISTL